MSPRSPRRSGSNRTSHPNRNRPDSHVARRYRPDDLHRVSTRDIGKQALVDFIVPKSVTKVVEVTDHHRREVEVELATRRRADPEAVAHSGRDENERA